MPTMLFQMARQGAPLPPGAELDALIREHVQLRGGQLQAVSRAAPPLAPAPAQPDAETVKIARLLGVPAEALRSEPAR